MNWLAKSRRRRLVKRVNFPHQTLLLLILILNAAVTAVTNAVHRDITVRRIQVGLYDAAVELPPLKWVLRGFEFLYLLRVLPNLRLIILSTSSEFRQKATINQTRQLSSEENTGWTWSFSLRPTPTFGAPIYVGTKGRGYYWVQHRVQCDQIWRNFDTLIKNSSPWQFVWGFI